MLLVLLLWALFGIPGLLVELALRSRRRGGLSIAGTAVRLELLLLVLVLVLGALAGGRQ